MSQPPIVPGSSEPYTLASVMPAATPPKRPGWVVPVIAGLAVLALAAVAVAVFALNRPGGAVPVADAPSTAAPNPNQVECVNIERAYRAWDGLSLPRFPSGVLMLNRVSMDMRTEDGHDFLSDVEGYEDRPSKVLAFAVAKYNVALGFANVQLTAAGRIDLQQAEDVVAAIREVDDAFTAFKTSTCA